MAAVSGHAITGHSPTWAVFRYRATISTAGSRALRSAAIIEFNGGWVIGLQGDYDWADGTGGGPHATAPATTDQSHISNLASVTGRVGYSWDRFLGYVKGGGAWERNNYLQFTTATGATFATNSTTRDGWTVGVGGEYAFTQNLSGFLEYDYYDFGNANLTFATVLGTFPHISIRETQSVVKAGLNWKLDWLSRN